MMIKILLLNMKYPLLKDVFDMYGQDGFNF